MSRTFNFFVPGVPKSKQYRQTKSGVIYNKGDVVAWERSVAIAATIAAGPGYKKMIGAVTLELHFYFPIPKTRTRELAENQPHLQDPDLTNLIKAAEDGLKKVLIADDNLVWRMENPSKRWIAAGKEGVQVRVMVEEFNGVKD